MNERDGGYKTAKFESDYTRGTFLRLTRTADGDIVISIHGDGECRIATSGGKLHGEKMVEVVGLFSMIIDALNNKPDNKEAEHEKE
jgi:hypothetical protein